MRKVTTMLALAGVTLLLLSFLPWAAHTQIGPDRVRTPAPAQVAAPTPTPDLVGQGAALFRAKGCVTCHRHAAVDAMSGGLGPDLTDYAADPAFLRVWLRDPAAVRPDTWMPNLGLQAAEIEALIAFLQADDGTAALSRAAPVPALPDEPPPTCPVTTRPDAPFSPPPPYPASAPYDGHFWYGTEALWTMLPQDGRWDQLARGEKVWWWRVGYDGEEEPEPVLWITARRLDEVAPDVQTEPPATNGYHRDFQWAMLTGLEVPSPGCWQVSGQYEGTTLRFVVWVAP